MKIGIIGAGRLGICFALLCEEAGHEVLVSDIREDYISDINNKKIKTTEPEVEFLLGRSNNLKGTTDNGKVIRECNLIYTFVATPSLPHGSYDVSSVREVVNCIKNEMKTIENDSKSFVVGCTTNPGDCDSFRNELPNNVKVFYNPEFIAQGSIVNDLRHADMVLFGHDYKDVDNNIINDIRQLYKDIQVNRSIMCTMSTTSAEISKIALNCFLTTKISYANMLGDVLHKAGCGDEVVSVLSAIGTDSRIGRSYLKYGFGYGGPCLPRDNRAFASFAKKVGVDYNLGTVVDQINNQHSEFICSFYERMNYDCNPFYFDYITYKKGTDILSESQQYRLCIDLLDRGHYVYINESRNVVDQVYGHLKAKYGGKVKFVDKKENIEEPIFIIDL